MGKCKIARATAVRFRADWMRLPEGATRADAFLKAAADAAAVPPDEKIKDEPAVGFCSPQFDGDRTLDRNTCEVAPETVRVSATQAARKVAASALRARVGELARAWKREHLGVPPCKRDLLAIKAEAKRALTRAAPVAYSRTDAWLALAEGVGLVEAAPGSGAFDRFADLFALATKTGVAAVTAEALCPKEFGDEPSEPLHPGGQAEAFSSPARAGREFLSWLLVECADGPKTFRVPDDEDGTLSRVTVRPCAPVKLLDGGNGAKSSFEIPLGESVHTPELGEALLSGKLVTEMRVEIADTAGGKSWFGTLDESLSLAGLELPPLDERDSSYQADRMRSAGRALGIVATVFAAWVRGVRMNRERWAGFAARCRTVLLDAIGDAEKLARAVAKWHGSKGDVDAIFAEDGAE